MARGSPGLRHCGTAHLPALCTVPVGAHTACHIGAGALKGLCDAPLRVSSGGRCNKASGLRTFGLAPECPPPAWALPGFVEHCGQNQSPSGTTASLGTRHSISISGGTEGLLQSSHATSSSSIASSAASAVFELLLPLPAAYTGTIEGGKRGTQAVQRRDACEARNDDKRMRAIKSTCWTPLGHPLRYSPLTLVA
eukprot:9475287-Pyramimonas_sp.AAC.2